MFKHGRSLLIYALIISLYLFYHEAKVCTHSIYFHFYITSTPSLNHFAVNVSAVNISSGVPSNISCPPFLPPPGPNSITQSLAAIKSRLCSRSEERRVGE